MPAQYGNEKCSKNFMLNLFTIVYIDALRPFNERRFVMVYLPFTPCFFNYPYVPGEYYKYVDIRPVYKTRLRNSDHMCNMYASLFTFCL